MGLCLGSVCIWEWAYGSVCLWEWSITCVITNSCPELRGLAYFLYIPIHSKLFECVETTELKKVHLTAATFVLHIITCLSPQLTHRASKGRNKNKSNLIKSYEELICGTELGNCQAQFRAVN